MAKNSTGLIPIGNFNQGGLAASKWSGSPDSFYKLVGFDPHSRPGVLDVAQKMTKISGSTVDEFCRWAVNSSNGAQYFFSYTSGKIWEVTSGGTVRLVHTTTPAAGAAGCLGAIEHEGYIYFATQSRLHRITVTNAALNNWAVDVVEDWATFGVTDANFHPMRSHTATQVLYIGDGNQVAQVDANIFSANALDIRTPLRIKCFGGIATDLLIGTYVSDNFTETEILRWNTWDDSFSNSDTIPEVGINAFLQADNMVLVQCGKKGNIYYYDGENLQLFSKIPGDYTATSYGEVYPGSVSNIEGQMLLGFSNGSGNPADQLVYRIARHSSDFSYIMDQPYPISERSSGEFVLTGLEIGAVIVSGAYIFVAWKNGTTYGIDKLDATAKLDGAYFETRIMSPDRLEENNYLQTSIPYALLPTNTDINFYLDINFDDDGYQLQTKDIDTMRNTVSTTEGATTFTTLQLKVKVTTSANTAPLIQNVGGGIEIQ